MNKKTLWYTLLCVLTVGFILLSVMLCPDTIGLTINIVAILAMATLLEHGTHTGLSKLTDATKDLHNAASRIKKLAEDPNADVEAELQSQQAEQPLFSNKLLNQAYLSHCGELDRLHRKQSDFCYSDIADYINQELLNHVGNVSYNDMIAGAMTGLGILGTFVGLIFGLQDFDPATSESMMETIPTLIDGMKIAFLTSIFGVVYSITFNIFYRITVEDASYALDGFQNVYYKYVLPRPENDGFTKLIQYQQSQSLSMSQFAEQISITMANALGASVVPTFERIERTIDQLSEKLAKTQDQNMERITTEFIAGMDKAMGDQMQHLGESINKICNWQETSMEKMQENLDQLEKTGEILGGVTINLQKSIAAMEQYLEKVEGMQSSLVLEFETIVGEFREANAAAKQVYENFSKIQELETTTLQHMEKIEATSTKRFQAEQEAMSKYRTDVTACCNTICGNIETFAKNTVEAMNQAVKAQIQQIQTGVGSDIKGIQETHKAFVAEMQKASAQLGSSAGRISEASEDLSNHLDKSMTHTYQEIDRQLAEVVRHLSGTIADIRDVTEKVPRMLTAANEQMQTNTAKYLSDLNKSQQQMLAALNGHNHQNKDRR